MTERAVVVGGGISGAACAAALVEAGVPVLALDRGRQLGGRMASRRLRDTGTVFDGRVVDIGASYFTVSDPAFASLVDALVDDDVVCPWTDGFHLSEPQGLGGVKSGPMRFAAPGGLRTVVEALWSAIPDAELRFPVEVRAVDADAALAVDEMPARAVAVCMPRPQAERILAADLVAALPPDEPAWEPVIAVTAVFEQRCWPALDGVFVNDDPVLTWIADDGRRRGDDAPVLVAHVHPVLAARHLHEPSAVVPLALASMQRILGLGALPEWVDAHRWTFARPTAGRPDPCWVHPDLDLGLAGDAWAGGPRVEAAWASGRALGSALAARLAGE